ARREGVAGVLGRRPATDLRVLPNPRGRAARGGNVGPPPPPRLTAGPRRTQGHSEHHERLPPPPKRRPSPLASSPGARRHQVRFPAILPPKREGCNWLGQGPPPVRARRRPSGYFFFPTCGVVNRSGIFWFGFAC